MRWMAISIDVTIVWFCAKWNIDRAAMLVKSLGETEDGDMPRVPMRCRVDMRF